VLTFEEEVLTAHEHLNEYIMTSLRTQWGCDLDHIAAGWDESTATLVEKSSHLFMEKKWVIQDGRKLLLTNKGKLFADRVAAELFVTEMK
jgi:oxygen-independent coproporphyrinogen III oxidase